MIRTAGFGPLGVNDSYRYTLGRDWREHPEVLIKGVQHLTRLRVQPETLGLGLRVVEFPNVVFPPTWTQVALFLMLNPSTANGDVEDPTVAKCMRVAAGLGYGRVEVRNIFAIRGTDPNIIKSVSDPVGPQNDDAIRSCAADRSTSLIVAAWGNHGRYNRRSLAIRHMLSTIGKPVHCFRVSKKNEPEHPLYQREDLKLIRWI